jgi:hypothetical protein|tara:strand:- start:1522 stop:1815 length:294 start_codon:yes stop_codon:yes gene_type:complete
MWLCYKSKFCVGVKGMSSGAKKGKTKKEMILGWRSRSGVLAFIINALCEGLSSIYSHLQTSTPSYDALEDFNKECNHKGQVYHCKKCDSDIVDDFGS